MRWLAEKPSARTWRLLGGFVIAIVVGLIYYSAPRIGFWSDDYAFIEPAARLSLLENLVWYFDPRAQGLWYRPIPGMFWFLQWQVFRDDAFGYHAVYVLIHLANTLLLYALVTRVARNWRAGFIAGLLYASFEIFSHAVLRPSDETALAALFYLTTALLWVEFLTRHNWKFYALAGTTFVLALFSKEASVTLPVMLWLVDVLLVNPGLQLKRWIVQYAFFALVLIPYLIFEFAWLPETTYKTSLGYGVGPHMVTILASYLMNLAMPWRLEPPLSHVWLALVILGIAVLVFKQRDRRGLFLASGALLTLAPYLPFQFTFERFLYVPMLFPAIAFGVTFVWMRDRLTGSRWQAVLLSGGMSVIILANGFALAEGIDWLTRFAREGRAPLRAISQRYTNFSDDAYLYFLDPPVPLYSGMFYLRYGPQVSVGGDIGIYSSIWRNRPPQLAGLRDHKSAYVFYFAEDGQVNEQRVNPTDQATALPQPPINFEKYIRLEGYEIASGVVAHGESILVLLYWQTAAPVNEDYTVFAHLVDERGETIASVDSQPRGGNMPTHSWRPGTRVVDWIIIPATNDIPASTNYRLEFGLYNQMTLQRLGIIDSDGRVYTDRVVLEPITIHE